MGDSRESASAKVRHAGRGERWRVRLRRGVRFLAATGTIVLVAIPVWPQQQTPDLTKVNIEDLMNIEVTSVSKKEQKLSRAAAAIFVISAEDIRRSGARSEERRV